MPLSFRLESGDHSVETKHNYHQVCMGSQSSTAPLSSPLEAGGHSVMIEIIVRFACVGLAHGDDKCPSIEGQGLRGGQAEQQPTY